MSVSKDTLIAFFMCEEGVSYSTVEERIYLLKFGMFFLCSNFRSVYLYVI